MKNLLTLILLISAFQVSFGQEKPKAEIYDKIGLWTCHDVKMRAVDFAIELVKDQNSIGYAVVYEKKGGKKRTEIIENVIKNSVYLIDLDRIGAVKRPTIRLVYGEPRDNFEIEFWKVPKDADVPKFQNEFLLPQIPDPLKPFIFGTEAGENICPTFSTESYVNFLKLNPTFNAHIVVVGGRDFMRSDFTDSLLKYLTTENNVQRSRIRFFFTKKKDDFSHIEYWIVPKK